MYLRMLRKDLKRNRVMNIILLVFIIIASMFVSSSASNIIQVMDSQSAFFRMAGLQDFFIMTKGADVEASVEAMEGFENLESFDYERIIFISSDNVSGDYLKAADGLALYSFDERSIVYFDEADRPIDSVAPGELLLPCKLREKDKDHTGEKVTVTLGDSSVELTIAGYFKDALLGAPNVGSSRCLVSAEDFEKLWDDPASTMYHGGMLFSAYTDSPAALGTEITNSPLISVLVADLQMISSAYLLNLAISGVLLVVSIALVLIAVVVLRFIINFTIKQEFRQIGVMKAVGLPNNSIGLLYLVKYFALALVGALIGFFAGIPFGKVMLMSISETLVLSGSRLIWVNALCAVLTALTVILFCWGSTRRIKKLSPVAAVRDGNQGERFTKKSPLSLSRSRLKPVAFLSVNDILCSIKRYGTMMLAFSLSLIMIIVVGNSANTLRSDVMVSFFASSVSDVYMISTSYADYFQTGGRDNLRRDLEEAEKLLSDKGIDARCCAELAFASQVSSGEYAMSGLLMQGTGTAADEYSYLEGSAPTHAGEAAITPKVAETLNIGIGDSFNYFDGKESRELIVCGTMQSMLNMGNGIRLHEDAQIDYALGVSLFSIEVKYNDSPDADTRAQRMERLKELFPDYKVLTGAEYSDYYAKSASTVEAVRNLLIPILLAICFFVAMLMERSFIESETGEIAMMKACGFKGGSIVGWHCLRMLLVLLISTIIAIALSTPATKLLITPIFRMMGANTVDFVINPLENFLLYPALLVSGTSAAVFITALTTRKISASQTSSIE